MTARTSRRGLAAISSPHPAQYDSRSFGQYGLVLRIDGSQAIVVSSGKILQTHEESTPHFPNGRSRSDSGIYRVRHEKHRLPHEVTLLKDQQFPRCSKCKDAVVFELIRTVDADPNVRSKDSMRIYLYEIPALEEDQSLAV
jgi:hypothetical protein